MRSKKCPYALHPVSQKFSQRCLWNGSSVRQIDDGPLSSFQGRSSSDSSFHAPLLQAIDGVLSLALCPQVASQVPQHFGFSAKQATCEGCFARQSIRSVISWAVNYQQKRDNDTDGSKEAVVSCHNYLSIDVRVCRTVRISCYILLRLIQSPYKHK